MKPYSKSTKSTPKIPSALFFTYSDGQVIPGREQIYIKGEYHILFNISVSNSSCLSEGQLNADELTVKPGRMRTRHTKLVAEIPTHIERRKNYKAWFGSS